MPDRKTQSALRIVRAIKPVATAPDSDLLRQFVKLRDESAFRAVVERHGPMVLRVCRRVLGRHHAAEDAFQATFLALSRHPERVRKAESLSAWLHGTAHRVALKARRSAARSLKGPKDP